MLFLLLKISYEKIELYFIITEGELEINNYLLPVRQRT